MRKQVLCLVLNISIILSTFPTPSAYPISQVNTNIYGILFSKTNTSLLYSTFCTSQENIKYLSMILEAYNLPKDDIFVNLNPYIKDTQIISPSLYGTSLGIELLKYDLKLKETLKNILITNYQDIIPLESLLFRCWITIKNAHISYNNNSILIDKLLLDTSIEFKQKHSANIGELLPKLKKILNNIINRSEEFSQLRNLIRCYLLGRASKQLYKNILPSQQHLLLPQPDHIWRRHILLNYTKQYYSNQIVGGFSLSLNSTKTTYDKNLFIRIKHLHKKVLKLIPLFKVIVAICTLSLFLLNNTAIAGMEIPPSMNLTLQKEIFHALQSGDFQQIRELMMENPEDTLYIFEDIRDFHPEHQEKLSEFIQTLSPEEIDYLFASTYYTYRTFLIMSSASELPPDALLKMYELFKMHYTGNPEKSITDNLINPLAPTPVENPTIIKNYTKLINALPHFKRQEILSLLERQYHIALKTLPKDPSAKLYFCSSYLYILQELNTSNPNILEEIEKLTEIISDSISELYYNQDNRPPRVKLKNLIKSWSILSNTPISDLSSSHIKTLISELVLNSDLESDDILYYLLDGISYSKEDIAKFLYSLLNKKLEQDGYSTIGLPPKKLKQLLKKKWIYEVMKMIESGELSSPSENSSYLQSSISPISTPSSPTTQQPQPKNSPKDKIQITTQTTAEKYNSDPFLIRNFRLIFFSILIGTTLLTILQLKRKYRQNQIKQITDSLAAKIINLQLYNLSPTEVFLIKKHGNTIKAKVQKLLNEYHLQQGPILEFIEGLIYLSKNTNLTDIIINENYLSLLSNKRQFKEYLAAVKNQDIETLQRILNLPSEYHERFAQMISQTPSLEDRLLKIALFLSEHNLSNLPHKKNVIFSVAAAVMIKEPIKPTITEITPRSQHPNPGGILLVFSK